MEVQKLNWFKTARRMNTQLADRRVWRSICGRYKVEEHTINYGIGKDKGGGDTGIPTYYLAMIHRDWGWHIISEHRKRQTAVTALEYFHQHGHKMPVKNDPIKAMKKKRAVQREQQDTDFE